MLKFKIKDGYKFGWKGLKALAYNSKEDFERASAAIFEVTERHGKVKSLVSDRVYLVLEGKGEFITKEEIVPVEKSDVVIVPKNTPYDYRAIKGKLKVFLVQVKFPEDITGLVNTFENQIEKISGVSQVQTLMVRRTSR